MPMHYVYIDGYWVRYRNFSQATVVRGQGGRIEPYGFTPDTGSLEMQFVTWLNNILAAAKLLRGIRAG